VKTFGCCPKRLFEGIFELQTYGRPEERRIKNPNEVFIIF
jgi:hypothetical protein